jgi:alpha-1,2-mannosyltransferase
VRGSLNSYLVTIRTEFGARLAGNRWVISLLMTLSVAGSLALAIATATGHQIDFDIYRMGANNVLGAHLYDTRLPRSLMGGPRGMRFNYPPSAALLFWPFTLLSISVGQLSWSVINLAMLVALIALSIKVLRPGWPRQRAWIIAGIVLFPALQLDPALLTLDYGQVNLCITLMVLVDLTSRSALPRGVLVGIAAAIKLTPLIFIPFLFLTRQFRAGIMALSSFLLCTLGAFAIAPSASRQYWSANLFGSKRSGNVLYVSNQDLQSALYRVVGTSPPVALVASAVVIFAIGGLVVAAAAYRVSSPMLGIITCAATGLIISPVSWAHHYVWVVPAIVWLALGEERPWAGPWLAVLTASLFWAAPIWWVHDQQTGYGGPLTLLAGNSFFLAAVVFVVASATRVVVHRRSHAAAHDTGEPFGSPVGTNTRSEPAPQPGTLASQPPAATTPATPPAPLPPSDSSRHDLNGHYAAIQRALDDTQHSN